MALPDFPSRAGRGCKPQPCRCITGNLSNRSQKSTKATRLLEKPRGCSSHRLAQEHSPAPQQCLRTQNISEDVCDSKSSEDAQEQSPQGGLGCWCHPQHPQHLLCTLQPLCAGLWGGVCPSWTEQSQRMRMGRVKGSIR